MYLNLRVVTRLVGCHSPEENPREINAPLFLQLCVATDGLKSCRRR